jgi:hypothetical protein
MNLEQATTKGEPKGFESYKDLPNVVSAQKNIKDILSKRDGQELTKQVATALYEMLTHRSQFAKNTAVENGGTAKYMENFPEQKSWYKNEIEKIGKEIDAKRKFKWDSMVGWFGINTRPEVPRREGINIKVYATIPIQEYAFVRQFMKLANKLAELAQKTDDIIQVKTPNTLTAFVSHNDSVVIHFKKPENQQAVSDILNDWMQENGITKAEREMGRTEIAADPKEGSFSELVSENIAKWVEQNSGKYPPEMLAELAAKYAIEQSQKSPL